ncbi:class I SAM-dependent methyltransferase [Phycicoccus sp. M110.8]|uniref:class I SAM-dependent methyltransferase n=1 Tax=Phycicoccus sp. M110.8 TaxID=3075433 RepID=UPI0028FD2B06|nr:class I SAM-dependent methyltransferase [Phycicoccus sp. M110.8]MDU0312437.1 class I SAM-dependent methyltransferase [Phycicoccus sp. M110.8]
MTSRPASSTAVLVCQGRAVADGRLAAGRYTDPVARELLDPSERALVDDVREGRHPDTGAARMAWELVRQTALGMVPRTVAIDRAVAETVAGAVAEMVAGAVGDAPDATSAGAAVEGGTGQVVILGAGLDARAWRMPELASSTVWEVDHPASQEDMRRRVGGRPPVAARLEWVAVDLADQPLAPALEAAGFDRREPSTWVWEGVVPYLTRQQVERTLRQVGELAAPGSRLVVNYQARSWVTAVLRRVMRGVGRLLRQQDPLRAEPWRSHWSPAQMAQALGQPGFRVVTDDDLLTLSAGMDLPGASTVSMRNGRVAVATRT